MWISPAFAQAEGAAGFGGLSGILPIVLIFVVFYFLLIRPQQKRQKAHREMLGALNRGDRIVTSGGIIGTITKIDADNTLTVEIAPGTKVKVMRGMVTDILSRTAAPAAPAPEDDDEAKPPAPEGERKARKRRGTL